MNEYQIGAYEALEWVWFMLRHQVNSPRGVEKARQLIFETLALMGGGENFNFLEKIAEFKPIMINVRHEWEAYNSKNS